MVKHYLDQEKIFTKSERSSFSSYNRSDESMSEKVMVEES